MEPRVDPGSPIRCSPSANRLEMRGNPWRKRRITAPCLRPVIIHPVTESLPPKFSKVRSLCPSHPSHSHCSSWDQNSKVSARVVAGC